MTVNDLIDDEVQVTDDESEEQGDEDELGMLQNSSIPDLIKISEAYRGALLYDSWLPLPIPMQSNEWHSPLQALLWLNHYMPPRSGVIIDDHPDTAKIGKLSYILGSCQETQHSIGAVIPSIPCLDMMHDQDQLKKTPHEHGKAAHQATFQH